jgi:hypothetical protein
MATTLVVDTEYREGVTIDLGSLEAFACVARLLAHSNRKDRFMRKYERNSVVYLALIATVAVAVFMLEGTALAQTAPTRYMISLLDRSGSMSQVRATGETRWVAAKTRAKDKITLFSSAPGLRVSVWTFEGSGFINHTNGFVAPATAIAVINGLSGPNGNVTPLAKSACDVVDQLVSATGNRAYRILALASDGEENSTPTSHPCYGFASSSSIAPYTVGSWHNKVYTKAQNVVVHVDLFDYITSISSQTATEIPGKGDQLTAAPISSAVPLASFFQTLANSTGGTYTHVGDSQPVPVAGDVTGDYCVDDDDIDAVFADYGLTVPPADPRNDLNGDRVVDYYDYQLVVDNYGDGSGCAW